MHRRSEKNFGSSQKGKQASKFFITSNIFLTLSHNSEHASTGHLINGNIQNLSLSSIFKWFLKSQTFFDLLKNRLVQYGEDPKSEQVRFSDGKFLMEPGI
jgi:hypothetical protein